MAKKELTINFSFSFGELYAQALEKQAYLERDQATLAPRGVTADRLTAYQALITTFEDQTPDEVYAARITGAVGNRDNTRESLGIKLRDLAGVAETVFGLESAEYKTFKYKKVAGSSIAEFPQLAENMADRGDDYQAQLTDNGISEADILAIRADIATYRTQMKAVDTANAERDVATQARRLAANALYTELAALANIGKIYFQDRDEALYNDYIIYSSSETAQTRTGRLAATKTKTRELEAIQPDTEIILKNEGEAPMQAYFSQHKDGQPAPEGEEGVFVTVEAHKTTKVLAGADLGFNPDIDAVHFTLHNPSLDKEVIYRVRIE